MSAETDKTRTGETVRTQAVEESALAELERTVAEIIARQRALNVYLILPSYAFDN